MPKVSSRSPTRKATRIYQFIINITLRCERKTCSTIKKSQNIMNMIVDQKLTFQYHLKEKTKKAMEKVGLLRKLQPIFYHHHPY